MIMKKKKIIIILFCIIILICIGIRLASNVLVDHANSISVSSPNMENVENGTYIGEYSCTPVHAKVEVTVKNHKFANITILEHDNGLGSSAESITEDIVKNQSLDVDTVSGATVSSKCILKAVETAIERGND